MIPARAHVWLAPESLSLSASKVKLLVLARVIWQFPHVARLALLKRSDRKFAVVLGLTSLQAQKYRDNHTWYLAGNGW